ncbi:hypothetical protein ANCDUO_03627 [Ancylostoma duodenale]|uniref:Uncharacterized protein n=1 Tax=Ancylostoma duodenale TaxID=51022 RepID=A0A0C2GWZ7_9BILA|nr:hypothetical protein ANCDUO_03627 [Ancylostoma duodenale]
MGRLREGDQLIPLYTFGSETTGKVSAISLETGSPRFRGDCPAGCTGIVEELRIVLEPGKADYKST